jgi:hypothetical protein
MDLSKERSQNSEINLWFCDLLRKRRDLRIGQMVVNALKEYRGTGMPTKLENAIFYIEDDKLIELIEKMLA